MSSIVVLNFFPAFTPPSSGGEMRLIQLYRAVARSHDVTILTSTDFGARFEDIEHTPRLRELRFPKDSLWRTAYATLERAGLEGELSGLAFALAVSEPSCELRQRARTLAIHADIVIHEFPFSEPIFSDGCPCKEIYNSHNFEVALLSSVVRGEGFEEALLKLMRLEGNLLGRAEKAFAVSADDAEKFRLFYGINAAKLGVCPNGIDDVELLPIMKARSQSVPRIRQKPQLLFIGSAHHPNVEAAEFLLSMAADLPDCEFVIAGGVCKPMATLKLPPNVKLLGFVDPATKSKLLKTADLYLNPVVLGSGTSLKALEALGAGIPMVSTPEGVRGISVSAGVHCDIAGRTEFADAVKSLLLDEDRCQKFRIAGAQLANDHYSWRSIAADFCAQLSEPIGQEITHKPLVLALNDYPVMQAASGGIARIRGLLTHLDCDVVLLSFGSTFDVGLIGSDILHVTIPKTAAHQAFENVINEGQPMSVNDAVASLFAGSNQVLCELASRIAYRASAVVFEHPYMAPVLDAIGAVRLDLPIIYSSHNVEATHKREILRGHTLVDTLTEFIGELEERLIAQSQLIVCCTEADQNYFSRFRTNSLVVPNGCAIPDELALVRDRRHSREARRVGFMGSGHGPNVEAALFIARELAPAMREVQFEIVGGVCEALAHPIPKNLYLHGTVSERTKTQIMGAWDVALNPVESGGGSSLKLPDYMAHALPTLSTLRGSRGFAVEDFEAGRVAELPRFREILTRMLSNSHDLERQQANARLYATERLTWEAITKPYREELRPLMRRTAGNLGAGRLLVVTYRYTEPSLGGAEEYLVEILKRLRTRFDRLDLAAVDVEQLTNHNHFGCRSTRPDGGAARRLSSLFDSAQFFPADEIAESESLARARDLERAWTREERTLLRGFVDQLAAPGKLRLFGGFFWPENHNGVTRRWTSPDFAFLAPQSARTFQVSGYAAATKSLRITLSQVQSDGTPVVLAQYTRSIPEYFKVTISLPQSNTEGHLIVRCEVDEHEAKGDHRPFGVLLDSASVLLDAVGAFGREFTDMAELREGNADLSEEYAEELRTNQFERWVTALRQCAGNRSSSMEEDFAAIRGPHSSAMQEWLAANANKYDVVLVQGIPFDVVPRSVSSVAAVSPRPRIIALPHFHGDDRFYHWRRYYDSFAEADSTLLFSASIAHQLKEVTENLNVVPGGGVRSDEHGDSAAESSFRQLHGRSVPFFLLLGRKTPSKGYEDVLRAHAALRTSGVDVDLVLIGPDEDGRRIEDPGVFYLGRQAREVIRGALRCCLALVTMSRSESFGIVICEAWLFGKAVIANRACYAFRELIRDGETGLLVSTETELIAAMRQLTESAETRDRLGRNGVNEVASKYTWEEVAQACFDVLVPQHV